MSAGRSARVPVSRLGRGEGGPDAVAVEEPLEIRLGDDALAVTMRTPGDDYELAAGFLYAEGVLSRRADLADMGYCLDPRQPGLRNVVRATPAPGLKPPVEQARRRGLVPSSCGICGKGSIAAALAHAPPLSDGLSVPRAALALMPGRLRAAQAVFSATGGLHAAGLFSPSGDLLCAREDVGRHNAVDKVVGRMFLDGRLPLPGTVLVVSGRASFEIVQKALAARIPVLAAVSAASSLAVSLACEGGMTLVGFLRDGEGTVYCGGERLA